MNNKEIWKTMISAEDLDKHMEAIGGVQANANLLESMLTNFPIESSAKVLVPGVGTGQIFDCLDCELLRDTELTFLDVNKEYLEKLKSCLSKGTIANYKIREKDIEEIEGEQFDSAIIVLLLEHVDWQKILDNIIASGTESFYIIMTKKTNRQLVTHYKGMPKSVIEFSKKVEMKLIGETELEHFFKERGFNLKMRTIKKILDGKEMLGLVFLR